MNNNTFWLGVCCGTVVGACVALFLAPRSGKELRSASADIADDRAERARRLTARAHAIAAPSRPS